ncbi:MAG: hypothetical protein NDI84_08255 [Steroidobacteraceae bacterium]|nr:hypothetical protein [Steroidobacteraceae bacterium]
MKTFVALCWLATLILSALGGVVLISSFLAEAAPAQGAAAAVACGMAVIPYVLTRCVEGLRDSR